MESGFVDSMIIAVGEEPQDMALGSYSLVKGSLIRHQLYIHKLNIHILLSSKPLASTEYVI